MEKYLTEIHPRGWIRIFGYLKLDIIIYQMTFKNNKYKIII